MKYEFYCNLCKRSLFSVSVDGLAELLNQHNATHHPAAFDKWTAQTIRASVNFFMPAEVPAAPAAPKVLPQYTQPHGTTSKGAWGGAPEPQITDADRKMLAQGKVKWD